VEMRWHVQWRENQCQQMPAGPKTRENKGKSRGGKSQERPDQEDLGRYRCQFMSHINIGVLGNWEKALVLWHCKRARALAVQYLG